MALHPFLLSLGFMEPVDIDTVERRFLDMVKERLQKVSTSYDENEVKQEEAWLRDVHARYFQYALQWVMTEARHNKVQAGPESLKLKKQAREVMEELQHHMVEFASCYMHINRFMTLLRDEMRREEERLGLGSAIIKDTKWTSDAGTMMSRYRSQKRILIENANRMKQARPVLESLEAPFNTFRHSIIRTYGADKMETVQRPVIAALRMKDFRRARKALVEISENKKKSAEDTQQLIMAGKTIIDTCEQYQDCLVSEENRLFLKPAESDQAYNAQMRELRKIKGFLGKYYMPYMQYKIDMLLHLKDKLLVIGSIESQMTLYKRLLAGLARPLADIKEQRNYESQVLDKIKYLLNGQFQEVPVILGRAQETVGEFRQGAHEFRDIETLDVNEIDTNSEDEAAVSGL